MRSTECVKSLVSLWGPQLAIKRVGPLCDGDPLSEDLPPGSPWQWASSGGLVECARSWDYVIKHDSLRSCCNKLSARNWQVFYSPSLHSLLQTAIKVWAFCSQKGSKSKVKSPARGLALRISKFEKPFHVLRRWRWQLRPDAFAVWYSCSVRRTFCFRAFWSFIFLSPLHTPLRRDRLAFCCEKYPGRGVHYLPCLGLLPDVAKKRASPSCIPLPNRAQLQRKRSGLQERPRIRMYLDNQLLRMHERCADPAIF
jgi:hypothetical protein